MGRLFLLIGCVMAVVLIVDSAMHDPDISPVVDRLFNRVDRGINSIRDEFGAARTNRDTCREANDFWRQLDLDLPTGPIEIGQVVAANNDEIAVLLVVTRIDENHQPTRVDLSSSLNLTGVFTRSADAERFRSITPPATSAKRLSAPGVAAITHVSACYTTNPEELLPTFEPTKMATPAIDSTSASPTQISTSLPVATVTSTATSTPQPTSTSTEIPTASPTNLPTETASRTSTASSTTVPTATETFAPTDTASATPTETATPGPFNTATTEPTETPTVVAIDTATLTQSLVPTDTVSALTPAVAVSPTDAPTPTPIFEANSTTGFAEWTVPTGWTAAETLTTDGSNGDADWVLPPFTVDSFDDYAVEIQFQIGETETCPRNFGIAIRGTGEGFYAGGIEWDCDSNAVIWISQIERVETPIQIDTSAHTLRVQVIGNEVSVLLDGQVAATASDDTYPNGAEIGFWSSGVPITISSVAVFDLSTSTTSEGLRNAS